MDIQLTEFDIIMQAGQSNAEGAGLGDLASGYEPSDQVYYLDSIKTVEHTTERVVVTFADEPFKIAIAEERRYGESFIGESSLYFARKYIENGLLGKGRKLLIVRAAVGGTGFKKGDWNVDATLYNKMLEMTDYALSLNKGNRVVAFLWHQGEHDAFERNDPERFEKQLFDMVQAVRARYGNVPYLAGDFVREWKEKNIQLCEPITRKIQKVIKDIGNAAFIETSALLSNNEKVGNGDDIHFCRESLCKLGERYCEEFIGLIKNG